MPSAPFAITVQDEEIQALLKRLAEKMGNMQPAMQALARIFHASFRAATYRA